MAGARVLVAGEPEPEPVDVTPSDERKLTESLGATAANLRRRTPTQLLGPREMRFPDVRAIVLRRDVAKAALVQSTNGVANVEHLVENEVLERANAWPALRRFVTEGAAQDGPRAGAIPGWHHRMPAVKRAASSGRITGNACCEK